MSKIGNIRVDVAASDAAYYAYAPHDSVTLPMAPDDLQNVINVMTYFGRHDYAIEDIQTSGKFDKLHFAEDGCVDLRALNAMAECVKRNPDLDYDAVRDYCDNFDVPVDPLWSATSSCRPMRCRLAAIRSMSIARTRCPATCGGHTASRSSTKPAKSSRRA